jgi:hypothetical protein
LAGCANAYGLGEVTGDHYSAEWVVEKFRERGIKYEHSKPSKSDIYLEALGPLNSRKVELLDNPR